MRDTAMMAEFCTLPRIYHVPSWAIQLQSLALRSLRLIVLMMEAIRTSETSDYFNETTQR
jgi:hypothetical protein